MIQFSFFSGNNKFSFATHYDLFISILYYFCNIIFLKISILRHSERDKDYLFRFGKNSLKIRYCGSSITINFKHLLLKFILLSFKRVWWEKVLFLNQIFEMEFLINLVLRPPEYENPIFCLICFSPLLSICACVSIIRKTPI